MKKGDIEKLDERLRHPQCMIGKQSRCCKNCLMGPCIFSKQGDVGACGANIDVISSRNLLRFAASGAAAHTGHASHILDALGQKFPEGYIEKKAPKYLLRTWAKLGILPRVKYEHFKEISEALHASTMGVDADYQDILARAVRIGIIDGYLGLYLATELEDKHYGKHKIRRSKLNLGVIKPQKINIAVHGHESLFAEAIAEEAEKDGNVNLVGVCCTGAALLARHGIPLAGNVVLQEDVIATGAIDAMAVDSQCVMPSLSSLAECYHTPLITTNPMAKIPGTIYLPVTDQGEATRTAKKIMKIAKANFKKRSKSMRIEEKEIEAVIGFDEDIADKLAEQLKKKEIKGVIAVIGCKNPRVQEDWVQIYKKLSRNYAIITTGCIAFELGKEGLLDGKRFFHLGSCVNNSRVAEVLKRMADTNKKRITDMPFLVSAPMPLTEKCIAIGLFFASLGVDVHFGYPMMITSDTKVEDFLRTVLKKHFQSRIFLEENPEKLYKKIVKGRGGKVRI